MTADGLEAESRAVLENLPVLSFLPDEARALVAGSFSQASYAFGDVVVREGEKADAFFVLVSGRARVVKAGDGGDEVSLALLGPGASFGEIGLLDPNALRTATVRASSAVSVLRLDKPVFDALLETHPAIRTSFELHTRYRSLNTFFRLHTPFARLPVPALADLLHQFAAVAVAKGELVFRQGEPAGPLYAVEEGRLRVFVEAGGAREYVRYLRKGDIFGEVSVFRGTPRTASVEAVSDCRLLALAPEAFQKVAAENPRFRAEVEEHIQQYDYRKVSRVPLDFADELLPAQATEVRRVGPEQVDAEAGPSLGEDRNVPPAPADGAFARKGGRIRRFPLVRQVDEMDCGAACLAMVCRHFGRDVARARIRELLFTATDGTSLRGLCRGAEALGLAARSVKVSVRNVDELPLPAVIHWGGNHWVVLYDVDASGARLADPAVGLRRVPREELEEGWTGYAALVGYTPAFERAPGGRSSAAGLAALFRPHARSLGQAIALAVVVGALSTAVPVFTQVVVDRVLVEQDVGLLRLLTLSLLAVLSVGTAAMVLQRYLLSSVAVRVDDDALDVVARRLLSLPMSYFGSRRTADIERRLQGMRQVRELVIQRGTAGLTSAAQLLSTVVVMAVYSPFVCGVFLLTSPLYLLLVAASSRWLKPTLDELEEAFGGYAASQVDAIRGIETVKALGAERSLRRLMLAQLRGLSRRQFRADFTRMATEGAVQAVAILSTVVLLWAGASEVLDGALTVGGLLALVSLGALSSAPIAGLLGLWEGAQQGKVLLERLDDVFQLEPEQGGDDRSGLLPVRSLEGRVRFQGVGFRYGGPESPAILDGISFEALPGQTVAIVGRSGSGKSTLVKCLAGLLEPTEGSILHDGVDMRTLDYRDLRRQVGFVLQESYLFDDTIARNIAFGEDEPDMDRVLWAARVSNAHEFVDRLPLGYETRVGEAGIALSGGQRQRLAIARAIYRQPPVVVLDEATAALDAESERVVTQNLDRLLEGRTAFVIAHQLGAIRDADLILVLEKGRLVERGTHDDLMARQGLYFYLCSQQLGL